MIAVFDFSPAITNRIAEALRSAGFEVQTACGEDEAQIILRYDRPNAVICSTHLNTLLAEARRISRGKGLLIVLTEESGRISRNRRVDFSYLRNPLPVQDIVSACASFFAPPVVISC